MPSATSISPSLAPSLLPIRSRSRQRGMKADLITLGGFSVQSYKYAPYNPPKKPHMPKRTIAVVNASGRQAASFIRVASAVGYKVNAQLRNLEGIVATEIASLQNVTTFVGDLADPKTGAVNHGLIAEVFDGVHLAFINTTMYGDEFRIGCALADAADKVGVQHYIYSSMPDHNAHNPSWPSLPLWSVKAKIEAYIRSSLPSLPTTFLYTGIYNNNFTSLHYPLFCMSLQPDGSFVWQAPFHPDAPLPWLDAEHDIGPAVLQLVKDGPKKWNGRKVALAFEVLSPRKACAAFSRGIDREVRYVQGPIVVEVPIPRGYKDQLVALEKLYELGKEDARAQPLYFGDKDLEWRCPEEALKLWEGHRGLEEYAREVFPLEEAANGLTWMNEEDEENLARGNDTDEEDDDGDEGLVMGGGKRREEEWLA